MDGGVWGKGWGVSWELCSGVNMDGLDDWWRIRSGLLEASSGLLSRPE